MCAPDPPLQRVGFPPSPLGLLTRTSVSSSAENLRFLGQMRYDAGAFINIAKGFHNRASLELDAFKIDSDFAIVVVSSGESMTFRFAPGAKVDDGFMDVALLSHIGRARVISLFDQVKKHYRAPVTGPNWQNGGGGGAHVFCEEVKHYQCKRLRLRPYNAGTYNVDGEILGAGHLSCCVLDEPIEILFQ